MAAVFRHLASLRPKYYVKFLFGCLQLQLGLIWSVEIWILGAAKLEAATENASSQPLENWDSAAEFQVTPVANLENLHHNTSSQAATENASPQPLDNWDSAAEFTGQVTSVVALENLHHTSPSIMAGSSAPLRSTLEPQPVLIAGPENFNPGLRLPPPKPPPKPSPPKPSPPKPSQELSPPPASLQPATPFAVLESLETDFRDNENYTGLAQQFIEPTAQFKLRNGNRIKLKSGFNSFEQSGIESVTNIPIQIGWEGKVDRLTLQAAGGVDLFNRLPSAVNFNASVSTPVLPSVNLSAVVEHGPYKFNAETLENRITAWRFGPTLLWQIDRKTSFFSSFRWGNYSDGNYEQQSFSRLERKFGQFSLAANLFSWTYERDFSLKSGYFSPPDFLVYSGELAWEGDIFDFLRCRLAANLGRQQVQGSISYANSYQVRCTAKLSPNVQLELGYGFSNLRNQDMGDTSRNSSLTSRLRVKF